jgi:hypothetical protein
VAGQSITFDFLTTGADRTASGFRKVGDNTVLAAKGAKVLSDAIEKLGQKEDRTAAESKILASALRQTGDAEDRVAARAVVADAAIRRLDDAMQDTNKHSGELSKTLGGLKLNPGLVGPLLALAPAIATLGGVGAGAAAGLSGAFIAGGLALSAFGAIAKPVLSDAKKAAGAVEKAQNAYNTAISNGVAPSKAFKAEQLAISKAYAGMSPAQIALSKQLGDMADAWDKVKTAETPVVTGALQPWLKSVTGLTSALGPIIAKIAPVIASLGGQFNNLVGSSAFKGFRDFIGSTGSAAVSAGGSTIIDLVKSFMILLPKFDPLIREAIGWISRLGPAVLSWASSKKAADQIQSFLQWFSRNGPAVGGFLKSLGAALAALAPGLTSGGALELKVMTAFLGFVAKLPPGLAKPLAEVAGAMLILQKTGVVTVGIKLTGLAAGASGAGAAAGPFAAAGAGIAGGILLGIRHALAAGWKTAVAELPKLLEGVGSILNFSASGWATAILDHFAKPVRKMWDDLGHFLAASFDITRHQVSRAWDVLMSDITTLFGIAKNRIGIVWDNIELIFLHGVQYILNIMGKLPGPLGAPFRAAKVDIGNSMTAIQADVRARTAQIQADFDRLHGKTVQIHMNGQGLYTISGNVIAASQGKGGSGNAAGGLAAGGFISGGTPGRDSVFAALMPGEVVVPVPMVKAGAVDHLRGQLPGFASGGQVSGPLTAPFVSGMYSSFQNQMTSAEISAMRASLKTAEAAARAAAAAAAAGGGPGGGAGVARWAGVILQALSLIGQPASWLNTVERRMNQESGGNPNIVNKWDSNWLAGHPSVGLMQVIAGTFASYAGRFRNTGPFEYGVSVNPLANTYAGLNYALHTYGSLSALNRPGGYAEGGLVPGYASGGSVGKQGAAYLKAWQSRHGGPYALAIGPKVLNEQIPEMQAAIGRATTLSHAGGLSAGQHKFWAGAAASEGRLLATLLKERTTERAWRTQLGVSELGLDKEIRAAGNLKSLAGPVRGWKAQLGRDKATVTAISKMLGYSDAYIKAHPAPKPGPVLPTVTHTYGGDVANNLGVVLAAALGPFTGAARGGMVFDQGGTLRPGWNPPIYNGTGRPEPLVPARGGGGKLQIEWVGGNGGDDLERWIRKNVRVRGGTGPGAVERAYGSR